MRNLMDLWFSYNLHHRFLCNLFFLLCCTRYRSFGDTVVRYCPGEPRQEPSSDAAAAPSNGRGRGGRHDPEDCGETVRSEGLQQRGCGLKTAVEKAPSRGLQSKKLSSAANPPVRHRQQLCIVLTLHDSDSVSFWSEGSPSVTVSMGPAGIRPYPMVCSWTHPAWHRASSSCSLMPLQAPAVRLRYPLHLLRQAFPPPAPPQASD